MIYFMEVICIFVVYVVVRFGVIEGVNVWFGVLDGIVDKIVVWVKVYIWKV